MKKNLLLIIVSFCNLYDCPGQAGEWTWMNGDSTIQSNGNFGIQGIPSASNAPPTMYEPGEFKDNLGNLWIFGGYHYNGTGVIDGDLSDLWRYDVVSNYWTWVKGPGTGNNFGHYGTQGMPSPLNNPACRGWGTPTWVDNAGNFWIYSGSIGYDDLWRYEVSTNEWTWMKGDTTVVPFSIDVPPVYGTLQVAAPTNTPGTRIETAATWTDNAGNLWLFGGMGYEAITWPNSYFNDLWKFDISINQWVWMKGANVINDHGHYGIKGVPSPLNNPPSRAVYSKWKDAAGNFYLFGGFNPNMVTGCYYSCFNDVWKYEISTNNWIWIAGDSTINGAGSYGPECSAILTNAPRNGTENRATCFDSCGNAFLFGCQGGACSAVSQISNEFWHYNTLNNQWIPLNLSTVPSWGTKGVSSASNKPPTVVGAAAWHTGNDVWVFGGTDSGNFGSYNSMWRYKIDNACTPCGMISAAPNAGLESSDTIVCEKNIIDFTDLSTNNPTSWSWYFPGAVPDTSSLQNPSGIYYANAGGYDVALKACNIAGCDSMFLPAFINILQTPPVPVISYSMDTLFSTSAFSYQWYESTNPSIVISTSSFYVTVQPGSYYVIICDSNGCCAASNIFVITGIHHPGANDHHFYLLPNPNTGMFLISMNDVLSGKTDIIIYNYLGEEVFFSSEQNTEPAFSKEINLSSCNEGIYFVKISTAEFSLTRKFVISRE